MNDLVIFSSFAARAMICAIILLHILTALLPLSLEKTKDENKKTKKAKIAHFSLCALNAALHIALFIFALINKAEADELLLVIMLSSAVGITAMGFAEKKRNSSEKN